MTKFAVIMTMTASPMPVEKQYEAMVHIQRGFEEAGKEIGCKVECKVIPIPESYDLKDVRDLMIASA